MVNLHLLTRSLWLLSQELRWLAWVAGLGYCPEGQGRGPWGPPPLLLGLQSKVNLLKRSVFDAPHVCVQGEERGHPQGEGSSRASHATGWSTWGRRTSSGRPSVAGCLSEKALASAEVSL